MTDDRTFIMYRYEIVVPISNNEGQFGNYMQAMRQLLIDHGFTGWTENASTGFWLDPLTRQGKFENGTVISIYSSFQREQPGDSSFTIDTHTLLCDIARKAMPDQNFIQVTRSESTTILIEA